MGLFLSLLLLLLLLRFALRFGSGVFAWIEQRLPVAHFLYEHLGRYPAPKNLNYWYVFGALALLTIAMQFVTGIWLVMMYIPTAEHAFSSVQAIMREVPYGWLIRYTHATGASLLFVVLYLHVFRSLLYGSYKQPRELLWLSGVLLMFLMMAEAYTGYVLPWGQMSFWACKVILSLFSTIPWIGDDLVVWLQGDYEVSGITLHRFFAFHVLGFSLIVLAMVFLHIVLLHVAGSNNPEGVDILATKDKQGWPKDAIGYYPYFVYKYIPVVMLYLLLMVLMIFYFPTATDFIFEKENFRPADPLVTPAHIRPAWYLSPYYAVLRAVPDKSIGALLMFLAIALWAFVPWLDYSPVRSMRYRSMFARISLAAMVVAFVVLGIFGSLPVDSSNLWISRVATVVYFSYFISLPIVSRYGRDYPVPKRIR